MHANMAAISSSRSSAYIEPRFQNPDKDDTFTFSNGWSVSMEYVTPALAKIILDRDNTKNRKYRRASQVEKLKREMLDGQFILLPDGLIFDEDGNLIQGQHRLDALLKSDLPGLVFIIWRNVTLNVFEKLDANVPRSFMDRNGTSREVQDIVNLIARIYFGNSHSHTENKMILEWFQPEIDGFNSYVGTTKRRGGSQAPVKVACLLRSIKNTAHAKWCHDQYRALVLRDYNVMENSVQSLNRQIEDGITGWDLLIRAWRAFDYGRRNNIKVQVKDNSSDYEEIKSVIIKHTEK